MATRGKEHFHVSDSKTNACLKEAALSRKCMEDNYYVKDKCTKFFENYRFCTKFWSNIRKERRLKGIKPVMPDEKERELIMQERKKGPYAEGHQSKPN